MNFGNFTNRIKSLVNFDTFKNHQPITKKCLNSLSFNEKWYKKLLLKQNSLNLTTRDFTSQTELFPSHLVTINLREIDDFEKKKSQKIEKYFWEEK